MSIREIRGSGVGYTLPYLGRFSGLWLIVSIGAVLVASVSTLLMLSAEGMALDSQGLLLLTGQTLFLVLALLGLAVFTTHRLAGPWIAVQRAFRDVKDGDLGRVLHIRTRDRHLKDVEREFNEMMESLRERCAGVENP